MWTIKVVTFFLLLSSTCCTFNFRKTLSETINDGFINDIIKDWNIPVGPSFGKDIYHYVRNYSYPIETHWVNTEDNYVLRVHRIPHGINRRSNTATSKPAVLLMHGLSGSSFHYIIAGPNRSLAFALADSGFDVWLGNNRGNTWSRDHMSLDPDADREEFWDFSYEKFGRYDLPAKIDYIIKTTGQQKIFYVGHSQGTTQFFAMAALRPEYNDKIALMSALAPVVYVGNITSPPMRILQKYQAELEAIFKKYQIYEIGRYIQLISTVAGLLCAYVPKICATVIYIFCGFDPAQMDKLLLSNFIAIVPNGMSKNNLIHYGQNIENGYFQRFNYGKEKNTEIYGSAIPPNFTISKISAPIHLYYSQNDFFSPISAVERLASELPNATRIFIEDKYWNHIDYILAKDVNKVINLPLIKRLQEVVDNGGTIPTPPPKNNCASINFVLIPIYVITSIILVCVYI